MKRVIKLKIPAILSCPVLDEESNYYKSTNSAESLIKG